VVQAIACLAAQLPLCVPLSALSPAALSGPPPPTHNAFTVAPLACRALLALGEPTPPALGRQLQEAAAAAGRWPAGAEAIVLPQHALARHLVDALVAAMPAPPQRRTVRTEDKMK